MNTDAAIKSYKTKGYKPDVLLDPDFTIPSMFGVTTTPATAILDENGSVIFKKTGFISGSVSELLDATR